MSRVRGFRVDTNHYWVLIRSTWGPEHHKRFLGCQQTSCTRSVLQRRAQLVCKSTFQPSAYYQGTTISKGSIVTQPFASCTSSMSRVVEMVSVTLPMFPISFKLLIELGINKKKVYRFLSYIVRLFTLILLCL